VSSNSRRDQLAGMLDDVGKDITPIRRGGGLRTLIGGASQTTAEERTTIAENDEAASEPARIHLAPDQHITTTADTSAAPSAPAPEEPARRRATAPAAPTRRRSPTTATQTDTTLRKNKTFTIRTDLARRLAITAATLDRYEYTIVERALAQYLRTLSPDIPTTRRQRGSDANVLEAIQRKNKTFTLQPDIVRDVAVAAASRGIFEYEIVEPALERYLDKLAGRSEHESEG
jgi:hypothetical protein